MNRTFFISLALASITLNLAAQTNDPVLLTINNKPVSKSEFERIYHKNNKDSITDQKSINDYMELFINFKLKVMEAQALGLDTAANFKQELESYRKQLTSPYLVDKETEEKLLKEAYDRKQWRLRASHILIKLPENPSPADTLVAYNKAMEIRNRIMKGEDFSKLALENSQDDVSKVNGGDISYFTVFSTVLPFENAAYQLKVGEISMPVHSQFGYHIIKLTDKQPNPGEVKVAHIMVLVPRDAKDEDTKKAEAKINEVYQKLQQGEDFAKLSQDYSDDKGSAKRGGELPWFGTGRMVPEFEATAFNLKKDEYSKPFRTSFGWHIIKKMDTRPIASFENERSDLQSKIAKDPRAQQSKSVFVEKLKKEYHYSLNSKNLDEIIKSVDTTLFSGNWNAPKTIILSKPIFTMTDSVYSQMEFVKSLSQYRSKSKKTMATVDAARELAKQLFKNWESDKIIAYEDARLEKKYPAFANLIQEYHDGILLFDLTDKMVWSKAIKDSTGLKDFYEKNKNNYMWDIRVNVAWINYDTDKCKDAFTKAWADNTKTTIDEVLSSINKKSTCLTKKETKCISKGEYPGIDKIAFNADKSQNKTYTLQEDKKLILAVTGTVPPQPKLLSETKGVVTADYQSFLEKQWIGELRKKYTIKVNDDVLKQVN
jgi:peptidyl-prolyl cis-trans isomerase SurA